MQEFQIRLDIPQPANAGRNLDSFADFSHVLDGSGEFALLEGDANSLLDEFPDGCVDAVITSPPYWQMREYSGESHVGAIGMESTLEEYVHSVVSAFDKVRRVLSNTGSLWLNIGDRYRNKQLLGIPWRVALQLQDMGWILRNEVIWDQVKGSSSARDRLRMNRESIFHFVKQPRYYYNSNDILVKPAKRSSVRNGEVLSATGVSGRKYRRQIAESTDLSEIERSNAMQALDDALDAIASGELVDFRMTIRGRQRVIHGNSARLSGRAKELAERGFYILKSSAAGCLPSDIWSIVPEDEWRTDSHAAVFPVDLLELPINATCPVGGVLLDPFAGTGSALLAAIQMGRRAIGIDISREYLDVALRRLLEYQDGRGGRNNG